MKRSFAAATALLAQALLLPITAMAAVDPGAALNAVGGSLPTTSGGNAGNILTDIMNAFVPLVNLVAIIVIVIAGLFTIISQDENQISTARKTVFAAVAALVLINIAGPLSNMAQTGFEGATGGTAGAGILSTEILGFISFIEVPVAIIAVIMIVVSGIRAIAGFGGDQGPQLIRRAVFSIAAGIVLIVAKIALTTAIGANPLDVFITGGPNSQPIVDLAIRVVTLIVSFMALAAVTVLVIAGIFLVVNKGDQEVADRAKGIIVRVLLGLFVILISAGLAAIFLI